MSRFALSFWPPPSVRDERARAVGRGLVVSVGSERRGSRASRCQPRRGPPGSPAHSRASRRRRRQVVPAGHFSLIRLIAWTASTIGERGEVALAEVEAQRRDGEREHEPAPADERDDRPTHDRADDRAQKPLPSRPRAAEERNAAAVRRRAEDGQAPAGTSASRRPRRGRPRSSRSPSTGTAGRRAGTGRRSRS